MSIKILRSLAIAAVSCGTGLPAGAQDNWILTESFPQGAKIATVGYQDSILITATSHEIWRSGDAGRHWKKVLSGADVYSLCTGRDGVVLAGGEGRVYYSQTRGESFKVAELPTAYPIKELATDGKGAFMGITGILDIDKGYTGDGALFNAGDLITWERRNTGLPGQLYAEHVNADSFGRWYVTIGDEYVTGNGGLFVSDDEGKLWHHVSFDVSNLGIVKTLNTFSISLTPQDSVIVSVEGSVTNFSVSVNIVKHRNDLLGNIPWRQMQVRKSVSSWLDVKLNPIHFASNGDWYASVGSTLLMGGTYFSNDQGKSWVRQTAGLGIAASSQYERQFYYEDSFGRIFMSQFLDERVYLITRSMRDAVEVTGRVLDDRGKPLLVRLINDFQTVYSGSEGYYRLKIPKGWSGRLTPVSSYHQFSPAYLELSHINENQDAKDFSGLYTGVHYVWGFVKDPFGNPMQGVEVTGFATTAWTNENGSFSVPVSHGWTGDIQVHLDQWKLTPSQMALGPVFEDVYALNFEARPDGKIIISGWVKDKNGKALTNAVLTGFPGEAPRIDSDGKFVALVNQGWSGMLSIASSGLRFEPESIRVDPIQSDLTGLLWVAYEAPHQYLISGSVLDAMGRPMKNVLIRGGLK
ncbi:MAG: hypothetical protein JST46_02625 [Bacteroidetes bacterium]|nr:hypothetical protein [Bacteroidota bacterium]